MRILIISNGDFFSTYGGGQVYVKNLVDEMIDQQMDIVVFSLINKQSDNVIIKKYYRGVELYEIVNKNEDILKNMIKELAPDIIHIHAEKALFSRICKSLSVPCVITAHHGGIVCPAGTLMTYRDEIRTEPISQESSLPDVLKNIKLGMFLYPLLKRIPLGWRLKIGRILQKLPFIYFVTPIGMSSLSIEKKMEEWREVVKNVDVMIAPSKAIADAMILNGLPDRKVRIIPHGIPISSLASDVRQVDSRNRVVKFFYVGRLCYIKGIHVLLEAFSKLDESLCELHLIGDGNNVYVKKLIDRFGDKQNLFFYGKIDADKVVSMISQFDVLVHPTICLEVFGLNITEALSVGKPVIATRCGGAEMQIEDGVNGLLVKPNDSVVLYNAMEWFIEYPEKVKKYSQNASIGVTPIRDHIKMLYNVYESLLHG